ncbi:MAG: UDP-3-O-(3-hydroxymyristoyl)glucosamine N-acyltransferase [Myxococcota bacterium]
MPGISVGELAARLGRSFEGDGEVRVAGVASLETAGPGDLSFVRSPRYADQLAGSRAGVVIVPDGVDPGGRPAIRSPDPGLDFARAVAAVVPAERPEAGVHPQAVVASDARVDASAHVGALAVIGARARVGPGCLIHPHAVVYPDASLGADCTVHAGAVIREGCSLGDRVILQPGVVIGGDGFGYAMNEQGVFEKVPQVGRVVVGDDVEIGANTTVDRATLGETRLGDSVKVDNLVMIAHNCDVGEGSTIVAQSGLAGSTIVGRRSFLMAQSGAAGHLRIGDGVFVGARGGITRDVPDGQRVWGYPAMEERAWHRAMIALGRLPEALRRLRRLERRVGVDPKGPGPG